jgi:hypothetical protein
MSDRLTTRFTPGIWLLAAGCGLFAVLLVSFVYAKDAQNQKSDEASERLEIAGLITSAEADGVESSQLLQEYVATGDQALLLEMQAATDTGVLQLTEAISLAGEDPNRFVERGAGLVQSAGEVIALRQTGDVQGAVTRLTELSPVFEEFIAQQDAYVDSQEAAAASALDTADNAETAATWLLVSAIIVGAVVLAAAFVGIRRRIAQRGVVGAASG